MAPADPIPETPDPLDAAAITRALAILLDVGTSLATELKTPTPDAASAPDRARAFDVVARAVRQTILLAEHLAQPRAVRPADDPAATRAQARRHVLRAVEDTIERTARPEAAETLHRKLLERMERRELDHDLLTYNPARVIRELCNDLGLTIAGLDVPPRRTPADYALLCARAAAPPAATPNLISRPTPAALRLAEN